MVEDEVDNF